MKKNEADQEKINEYTIKILKLEHENEIIKLKNTLDIITLMRKNENDQDNIKEYTARILKLEHQNELLKLRWILKNLTTY